MHLLRSVNLSVELAVCRRGGNKQQQQQQQQRHDETASTVWRPLRFYGPARGILGQVGLNGSWFLWEVFWSHEDDTYVDGRSHGLTH